MKVKPETAKMVCKVNSNLVDLKKTLQLLTNKNKQLRKDTTGDKENAEHDNEVSKLKSENSTNSQDKIQKLSQNPSKQAISSGTYINKENTPPSQQTIINLQSPLNQKCITRIYTSNIKIDNDETILCRFKTNISSKKHIQGENGKVQKSFDKFVAKKSNNKTRNVSSVHNLVDVKLVRVQTNNNMDQESVTRQQTLENRKLLTQNDSFYKDNFAENQSTSIASELEILKRVNKNSKKTKALQTTTSTGSSSPKCDFVQIQTVAVIEPLPNDGNKCNRLFKKPKRDPKTKTSMMIDFDAIEIIDTPKDGRCTNFKRKHVNLPKTLKKLIEQDNLGNEVSEINSNKENLNSNLFINNNKENLNSNLFINNNKQNLNSNLLINNNKEKNSNLLEVNVTVSANKNATPKKERVTRVIKQKSKTNFKRQGSTKKDIEICQTDLFDDNILISQEMNKHSAFLERKNPKNYVELLKNSLQETMHGYHAATPPKASVHKTAAKRRRIYNKNKRPQQNSKNKNGEMYYINDTVMRKNINDGYESLHSDDELFVTKKENKRKINTVTFKAQSSNSSPLAELEIELKTPPRPTVIETLSDSDSPLEVNNIELKQNLPNINITSNVILKKPLQTINTPIQCISAAFSNKSTTVILANVAEPSINEGNASCNYSHADDQDLANLALDIIQTSPITKPTNVASVNEENEIMKTNDNDVDNIALISTTNPTKEEIMSWIATGLPTDAAELFKSNADTVLCAFAEVVKAYLELLKGPLHHDLTELYDTLNQHDHIMSKYFKKS